MSWIDDLQGYITVLKEAVPFPSRKNLAFYGDGITIEDVPSTGTTKVIIDGNAGTASRIESPDGLTFVDTNLAGATGKISRGSVAGFDDTVDAVGMADVTLKQ